MALNPCEAKRTRSFPVIGGLKALSSHSEKLKAKKLKQVNNQGNLWTA
jgi:hypothetical protein